MEAKTSESGLQEMAMPADPRMLPIAQELFAAIQTGRNETVRSILDAATNDEDRTRDLITAIDQQGRNALHWAAARADSTICSMLLVIGADVTATDYCDDTPLHVACAGGSIECVKVLVEHEAPQLSPNYHLEHPIHTAIKAGAEDVVVYLLEKDPSVMQTVNCYGRTALHMIAGLSPRRATAMVAHIMPFCEMDKKDKYGRTALHYMALNPRSPYFDSPTSVAWQLVEHGASMHLKDLSGRGPIYYALKLLLHDRNKRQLLRLIVEHRAMGTRFEREEGIGAAQYVSRFAQESEFPGLPVPPELGAPTNPSLWIRKVLQTYNPVNAREILCNTDLVNLIYREYTIDTGNGMWNRFRAEYNKQDTVNEEMREFLGLNSIFGNVKNPAYPFKFYSPTSKLVTWAVVSGNLDLVIPLLEIETFEAVPTALFCCLALQKFLVTQEIACEVKEDIREIKQKLEIVVSRIISTSFEKNHDVTIRFLLTPMLCYDGLSSLTCVQVALYAECSKVLTDPNNYSQHIWNQAWLKDLSLNMNKKTTTQVLLAAIIGLLFPPLLPFYLAFSFPNLRKPKRQKGAHGSLTANPSKRKWLSRKLKRERTLMTAANKVNNQKNVDFQELDALEVDESGESGSDDDDDNSGNQFNDSEGRKKRRCMSLSVYFDLMRRFYTIPQIKFYYHTAAHLTSIFTFTVWMLFCFLPRHWSVPEIITHLLMFGFIMEEVKQILGKGKYYFTAQGNFVDMISLSSYLIALSMRIPAYYIAQNEDGSESNTHDALMVAIRLLFALSLCLWYIRVLYIASNNYKLGPILHMIIKMLVIDLLPFLFILFVFQVAFGVTMYVCLYSHAARGPGGVLHPNGSHVAHTLREIFHTSFYAIVGEYNLDMLSGKECTDESVQKCPDNIGRVVVPYIVMPVYVVVVSVLLLNLLIALFSNTVTLLSDKSIHLWHSNTYNMIEEYDFRCPMPPPLNIPWIFFYDLVYMGIRVWKQGGSTKEFIGELAVLEFAALQEPWDWTTLPAARQFLAVEDPVKGPKPAAGTPSSLANIRRATLAAVEDDSMGSFQSVDRHYIDY